MRADKFLVLQENVWLNLERLEESLRKVSDENPLMENVLLVSVFVTNKALSSPGNLGHSRTGSPIERLEIFLTSLRSWSNLQIKKSYFFIELDEEFIQYRDLVAAEIESGFADPIVKWERLLYFKDWFEVSSMITKNADLIVLMANDDHAYIHTDPAPFLEFCGEVLDVARKHDQRALGDLTQLPGPIRRLAHYSPFSSEEGYSRRSFEVTTIHGCCLVTPKLFAEWWVKDFTEGKRIPRPDNPFGPSVEFTPAEVLVPSVEIMRHMDGIGDGTRITRKYNVLRPTCRIEGATDASSGKQTLFVHETPWSYSLWPADPYSHSDKGGADLYRMYPLENSFIERVRVDLSRLVVAYQKVYAPQLSRELIVNRNSSFLYLCALNVVILLDFATFFNFLIWVLFDLPNQFCIKIAVLLFGKESLPVKLCKKIRNRIFQHLTVRILRHSRLFPN